MENFLLYFAAAGMVVGALMLLGSFGLLMWALWMRWYVEPSRRAAANATASEAQTEATQQ